MNWRDNVTHKANIYNGWSARRTKTSKTKQKLRDKSIHYFNKSVFIWIRCVGARKHLGHTGQGPWRTGFGHPCLKLYNMERIKKPKQTSAFSIFWKETCAVQGFQTLMVCRCGPLMMDAATTSSPNKLKKQTNEFQKSLQGKTDRSSKLMYSLIKNHPRLPTMIQW